MMQGGGHALNALHDSKIAHVKTRNTVDVINDLLDPIPRTTKYFLCCLVSQFPSTNGQVLVRWCGSYIVTL